MEERLIPFDRRTQRKHIFALRTRRQFLRQAIPLALFAAPAVCWLARYAETLLSSIVAKKAQTLRELAQERGIYIGTAAKVLQLQNEAQYRDTLSKEFDIITPELAMKFDAIHPQRYVYDFRAANTLVAFARKHAMQIRGHTLVWHKALPDWLTQGNFSNWELDDILQKHVETVIKQYRGQVQIWGITGNSETHSGPKRYGQTTSTGPFTWRTKQILKRAYSITIMVVKGEDINQTKSMNWCGDCSSGMSRSMV